MKLDHIIVNKILKKVVFILKQYSFYLLIIILLHSKYLIKLLQFTHEQITIFILYLNICIIG